MAFASVALAGVPGLTLVAHENKAPAAMPRLQAELCIRACPPAPTPGAQTLPIAPLTFDHDLALRMQPAPPHLVTQKVSKPNTVYLSFSMTSGGICRLFSAPGRAFSSSSWAEVPEGSPLLLLLAGAALGTWGLDSVPCRLRSTGLRVDAVHLVKVQELQNQCGRRAQHARQGVQGSPCHQGSHSFSCEPPSAPMCSLKRVEAGQQAGRAQDASGTSEGLVPDLLWLILSRIHDLTGACPQMPGRQHRSACAGARFGVPDCQDEAQGLLGY